MTGALLSLRIALPFALCLVPISTAEAGRGCIGPKCDDTQMGFLMALIGGFGAVMLATRPAARQWVRSYVPFGFLTTVPLLVILVFGGLYWIYFGRDHFAALVGAAG